MMKSKGGRSLLEVNVIVMMLLLVVVVGLVGLVLLLVVRLVLLVEGQRLPLHLLQVMMVWAYAQTLYMLFAGKRSGVMRIQLLLVVP
tara:strand:+ start:667 stop:927 length:261 start_codon:yes stop_codon:yes gene_type:complete